MSLPFWEDKCWGTVLHCFHNEQASVSYLEVNAGYRCSLHYHKERANTFIVISGSILVEQSHIDKDAQEGGVTHKVLHRSDSLTVPSGVPHRFTVLDSGKLIEVYFPDRGGRVMLDDIVRFDVGGPVR